MKTSGFVILFLPVGIALATVPDWQLKVSPEVLSEAGALGETDFVIEMAQSADLAPAALLRGKSAKNRFVFEALRDTAQRTQTPVREKLNQLGIAHQSFWIANVISARGNLATLQSVAAMPEVSHVYGVGGIRLTLPVASAPASAKAEDAPLEEPGLLLVRAPEVWKLGFRGQGVVVASHDSGVFWEHAALKKQYRGWDGKTADHAYNWHNAFARDPYCADLSMPCDGYNHGTHTTGTMVGDDGDINRIGMAPKAQWIACRSLLDPVLGTGILPTYMECMEWTLAPYPTGDSAAADPDKAPDVVNNSWHCVEGCPPTILQATNEAIKAAGIVQVVSAGNDGDPCSTIVYLPGIYDSSFTVGASNFQDKISATSSRGPVLSDGSMRIKPNVVAPGVNVRSSLKSGGYGNFSGTSMSSPHVAGLVALIFSAAPELKGEVDAVREIIQQTAVPITTGETCGGTTDADIPNNTFGYGRIDALAAVKAAIAATKPQKQAVIAESKQSKGLLLGAVPVQLLLILAMLRFSIMMLRGYVMRTVPLLFIFSFLGGASPAHAQESPCEPPGLTILTDAEGDWGAFGVMHLTDGIGTPEQDLLSLQLAELEQGALLQFTLKVVSMPMPPVLAPFSAWFTSYQDQDGIVHGVRMEADAAGRPTYYSYESTLDGGGNASGRFVAPGTQIPAESGSGYKADGTITLIVKAADFGVKPQTTEMRGFNAATMEYVRDPTADRLNVAIDLVPDALNSRDGLFEVGHCKGAAKVAAENTESGSGLLAGSLDVSLLIGLTALGLRRRKTIPTAR